MHINVQFYMVLVEGVSSLLLYIRLGGQYNGDPVVFFHCFFSPVSSIESNANSQKNNIGTILNTRIQPNQILFLRLFDVVSLLFIL